MDDAQRDLVGPDLALGVAAHVAVQEYVPFRAGRVAAKGIVGDQISPPLDGGPHDSKDLRIVPASLLAGVVGTRVWCSDTPVRRIRFLRERGSGDHQ